MHTVGIIFAVGGIVLTLFLFLAYSRKLLTPFREMIQVMRHVQRGDMSRRVVIHGKDEIAELGLALNRMITQLDDMIISEYRSKLKQQDAEMQALQSQIKPHFLYNTLSGFIGLNRKREHGTLDQAIRSLSGLLRYILSSDTTITLEEEFEIIRKYTDLQQMRFSDRLSFHLSLDPRLKGLMIPKLLLQPLVENSVVHGTEPSEHPCLIEVDASLLVEKGRRRAFIRIADNGVGFQLMERSPGERVGLRNVEERLTLAYRDHSSFTIQSTPGQGTLITITIDIDEEVLTT